MVTTPARITAIGYLARGMGDTAGGTPDHVVENFYLGQAQLEAELAWVRSVSKRISAGKYGFQGEDPARQQPHAHPLRPPPDAGSSSWDG
jgi:hypothetical protein